MRNALSEIEIKYTAAQGSGLGSSVTEQDLKDDSSPPARKVNRLFKFVLQDTIIDQPWNCFTKREPLSRGTLAANEANPYSFVYDLPFDAYVIWDIYDTASARSAGSYSPKFSPFNNGDVFAGIGEIIGGKLASDLSGVSMFYTSSNEIDERNYSPHFVSVLTRNLVTMLGSSETNPEMLSVRTNINDKENKRSRSRAAFENRKAYRVPRATILDAIDNPLTGRNNTF